MSTSRYGVTLYGTSGLTYGAATVSRPVTWIFEVDWDNDGYYTGDNEGLYLTHPMEIEAGRQFFVRSDGQGFEPVQPSRATLTLLNTDGRYDPFNLSSPLAGLILPGRRFRLRVRKEADGTIEDVMVGRIVDIRPNYGDVDTVRVELVNAVEDLKKKNIRTSVFSTIPYDDALVQCLIAFNWTDTIDIDTTVSEAMNYWWARGENAFEEITMITEAALGMFCVAEDGSATYKSRISGETPLMTITDAEILNSYQIRTPMPWETIFNVIRVYARKRTAVNGVTLWQAGDIPLIPAGESREIWAEFSYNDEEAVATSVTTPVENTDYEANSQSDGGGTDLSANITVTTTDFATASKLVVANGGGTDAYMTLLKLRGNAIVADKYTFVERDDTDSIEDFGERELIVKSDWLQDINTAIDEATILRTRLATQRQFPRFKMLDQFDLQFGMRLFALVQIDFEENGITGEYRIGWYKHRSIDELCYKFETEVFLEPNLLGNVSGTWVFPAVFGTTTVF